MIEYVGINVNGRPKCNKYKNYNLNVVKIKNVKIILKKFKMVKNINK